MACGLEARLPMAEIRRLWNELKVLNETLSNCVETAEVYLRSLDVRVASTKAYFAEIRGRLSSIPAGTTVMDKNLEALMEKDAEQTKEHFDRMRSDAEECYAQVTRERSRWMDDTTRLIEKQMTTLNNIDVRALRHYETMRLRARILKTFQDIINVEGEVKNLQKVLYDCEMGKAELEEDFVGLVKIFQELRVHEEMESDATTAVDEKVSESSQQQLKGLNADDVLD
ncbi:hypothetical protein BV898_03247 [Hypsibius exemplaris]|uniref:Uncharacterized protein n=1 Tax=Hypsibius exemplaris TaxID=2072580 RepID=A0A1W0X5Q5_HYPEX|nr:hypothetical protein BV898_03247 [Hypsibius exemplaris]